MVVVVVAVVMVMLIVVMLIVVMVNWTPLAIAKFFNLPHPHCPSLLGQLSSTGWDIVFQIRVVNVKEIEALLQHHFQGAVYCAKIIFLIPTERQSFYCAILSLNNQNI